MCRFMLKYIKRDFKRGIMKYSSTIKDSKEYDLAKSLLYNLALSVFITLALTVIIVYALKLRLDVVQSDSMSPVFYKDDIVVVRAYDEYNVGDIIEYQITELTTPVTHRIVEKKGSGKNATFVTQGDANGNSDGAIAYSQINGKVIAVIEDGNLIYEFVKSNYFLLIDILLGVWVLTSTINTESEIRKHNIAKVQ